MQEFIGPFADYVTLVYHEARNVRKLVQGGFLDGKPYERITHHLPKNRWDAWRKLQPLRVAAKKARSAREAERIFHDKFGKDLEELVVLFENPNWRHAKLYGGNRWADITRAVFEFRDAIEGNDLNRASKLEEHIQRMVHNTGGTVEDKIGKLDTWLESH